MGSEIATILGGLGTSGGMAVVAWMFRKNFPRVAQACLFVALLPISVIAVWEVADAVTPPSYELRVSPPLPGSSASQNWGGVYESGASVEKISVIVLKDGAESESVEIGPIDFADRELTLELDPDRDDRMMVNRNSNPQGGILFQELDGRLRDQIFAGSVKPVAVSYTEEANRIGDRVAVNQASVAKPEFQDLEIGVKQWIYRPQSGVGIDIFLGDERVAEDKVVTRENPLAIEHDRLKATVALATLDFQDEERKRAKFIVLKYPAEPGVGAGR